MLLIHYRKSLFNVPQRQGASEQDCEHWIYLLQGNTPLNELVIRLPHGIKAHHLLDILYEKGIPVSRAVWCIRIFGANEMHNHSPKSQYNYSIVWTDSVCQFLIRRLNNIMSFMEAIRNLEQKRAQETRKHLLIGWKYM